jgi:hypothetical protein
MQPGKMPKVIVKIALPEDTTRHWGPPQSLRVKIVALLNFQSWSLPLPNPVAKIAPMVTTKPPWAKTTVI